MISTVLLFSMLNTTLCNGLTSSSGVAENLTLVQVIMLYNTFTAGLSGYVSCVLAKVMSKNVFVAIHFPAQTYLLNIKMLYVPNGLCKAEPNEVHLTVFPFYCVRKGCLDLSFQWR